MGHRVTDTRQAFTTSHIFVINARAQFKFTICSVFNLKCNKYNMVITSECLHCAKFERILTGPGLTALIFATL